MNTIFHNFRINAPANKVFEAISDPKHLINWWPLKCSGKAALGETYNFNFTDQYDWYGQVTTCEPNQAFYIKMTKADQDWDPTTFGFDLESGSEGVDVSFWHKDWPDVNQHFKIASFCWAILLQGLKNYVERGEIVPFEKRS